MFPFIALLLPITKVDPGLWWLNSGQFALVGMNDAIVCRLWMWHPCGEEDGSEVGVHEGNFFLAQLPWYSIAWQPILFFFSYQLKHLALWNCLVQTTSVTQRPVSLCGAFCCVTKKDGLHIMPSLIIISTLELHGYNVIAKLCSSHRIWMLYLPVQGMPMSARGIG